MELCTSTSRITGKERDADTGFDYFGARHYSSSLGRFITPDWAATPIAVPYTEFADPQSLNLFTYVRNNPMARVDLDGHCGAGNDSSSICASVTVTADETQKPTIEVNHQPTDKSGNPVGGKTTGPAGELTYTVKADGKPQADVKVSESIQKTNTVGNKKVEAKTITGEGKTDKEGKFQDRISFMALTDGSKATNDKLVQFFSSSSIVSTTQQTLTLTFPNGGSCLVTNTRTLTNVGSNGQASPQYTITTTKPTVITPTK